MLNKGKFYQWLSWVLVGLWMFLIFHLSSQPATQSENLSMEVTQKVIETIQGVTKTSEVDSASWDHIIRKCAHFSAYLVLALLAMNALRRSGQRGVKQIIFTMVICVLYACSDEIHQIFVSGRGPQVRDVLIDSTGSLVGIGLLRLIRKRGNRTI